MPIDVERWNEADSDPLADIQRWIAEVHASNFAVRRIDGVQVVAIKADTDYWEIERRILAAMALDGEVLLDIEPGEYPGRPDLAETLFRQSAGQLAEAIKPAMKQNGRSAEYLKHDRSKRHDRRNRHR